MRPQDLKIGEFYRNKRAGNYGWAKVIDLVKPGKGENTTKRLLAKCEWTVDKTSNFGLIKYFSPDDLIKPL